jgi:hypothetical protein
MKRIMVLSVVAASGAAPMLALTPTSASAFSWCTERAATVAVAPRTRVYGYSAYRTNRPYYRARVYRASGYRPVMRSRWQ